MTYVADFNPLDVRGERDNESELVFEIDYGLPPFFALDFLGGYTFEPPLPLEDERPAYYQPFVLGLTLGTLDLGDAVPGLRFSYARDLNDHETERVGVRIRRDRRTLRGHLGPALRLSAGQGRSNPATCRVRPGKTATCA